MALCVCRHGPAWHADQTGLCNAEGCQSCHRFRPLVESDGAMDGVSDHVKGTLVSDHAYQPRGEVYWSLCAICGLARAAHTTTQHAEGGAHAHSDAT